MYYNKLVRDKIPQHIASQGGKPIFRIAKKREHWKRLKHKLVEEAVEFGEKESPEELADLLEVIDAIIEFKKFHRSKIKAAKQKKATEKGRFRRGVILIES